MTNTVKQILGEDIPGSTDADVTADEFYPVPRALKFDISVNWEEAGFGAVYDQDNIDELLGEVLYELPNDSDIDIVAGIDAGHHDGPDITVIPIEISADDSTIATIKSLLQQRNQGHGWSVSNIRVE